MYLPPSCRNEVKFHAVVCVVDVPGKMNRGSDNAMMEILLKDGLMKDTLENSWGQIVLVGSMVDEIIARQVEIKKKQWMSRPGSRKKGV